MKVLFTTSRGLFQQQLAEAAIPAGIEVEFIRDPTKDQVSDRLRNYDVLISERAGVIDASVLNSAPNLKLIQRLGSYTADIDLHAAKSAGIPVCSMPVRGCVNVAEHMVWQMLSMSRRAREQMEIVVQAKDFGGQSKRSDEDTFAYNWSGRKNLKGLQDALVGILGFGEIGIELARRLRGFECRVLYNKRTRLPEQAERELAITYNEPDLLVSQCDFLVTLLPYSKATDCSINARMFNMMPRGSFLAHCGGSGTVDEDALIAALRAGHLGGAALDTYTFEPMRPNDPLVELARDPMANLFLTPHTAAGAGASKRVGRAEDFDNIVALAANAPLIHRVV